MIEWTISHAHKLVSVAVTGRVTEQAFEAYLVALRDGGAGPYRKIFGIYDPFAFTPSDIPRFAALTVKYISGGPVGPLAVVVDAKTTNALAEWFRSLASMDRPVRIFRTQHDARLWLDGIAPVDQRSGETAAK